LLRERLKCGDERSFRHRCELEFSAMSQPVEAVGFASASDWVPPFKFASSMSAAADTGH